ncbi:hypothetical protein Q4E93_15895 [Flavitalea sp. BT771]|uniref:hypothetical protein n=1 Tax=Flavitalea sp. BT771 TaxID=3063329 RepID=UPI0026E47E7B|nr:hypothetical protein [Flavitalea sp. BT771]MDO6432085.1 hypothetical protein [Flavitalea sp. BT771]MDV6220994.1 hypothetical protein [Flavitalea sp. BT771]
MHTHADKSKENRSRSVADSLSKHRSNSKMRSGIEAVIQGKFQTDWGEFDEKHLSVRKEDGNEVGVEIFISYDPGEKTDATAIGMTQIVRSSQQDKPYFLSERQGKQASSKGFHIDRPSVVARNPLYATGIGKPGEQTLKETGGQAPVEKIPTELPRERSYSKYPGEEPEGPVKIEETNDRSSVVNALNAFDAYQKGNDTAGELFSTFSESVRQEAVEEWQKQPMKQHMIDVLLHPGLVHKGVGEHGYRNAETGEKKPATLLDGPQAPMSHGDFELQFETTALAIDGKQAGTYYGSAGWGFRRRGGKVEPLPLYLVSRGLPSDNFKEAAEAWNASQALRKGVLKEDTGFYNSLHATTPVVVLKKGTEVDIKGSTKGTIGILYEVSNFTEGGYVLESAVTGVGIPVIPLPEPWKGGAAGRQGIDRGEKVTEKRTEKKSRRRKPRIAIIHDPEEVSSKASPLKPPPLKPPDEIPDIMSAFNKYQTGDEAAGIAFLKYSVELRTEAVKQWVKIHNKGYSYPGEEPEDV